MKYLDFSVQTAILLLAVGGIIKEVVIESENPLMVILCAQLALGPWQYISSLVSVITKAPFLKQKRLHLIISTLYLFLIFASTLKPYQGALPSEWSLPSITIPAWTLGLYYFGITCRWTFSKTRNGGKFLPHLSF